MLSTLKDWFEGRIKLPNNCRAGKVSVFPNNWKTVKANPNCKWRITYWFYDDNTGEKKQVVRKGMNDSPGLKAKQESTQFFLEDELYDLQVIGLNQITGVSSEEDESSEISEHTPFNAALDFAFKKVKGADSTISDLKGCLKYFKLASCKLHYDRIPVMQIKRRQLIRLLEVTGEVKTETDIPLGKTGKTKKGTWTSYTYNKYRSNLSMLYRQLNKVQVVPANLVDDIDKEKTVKRIRETLTEEQRMKIDETLFKTNYYFWRLLNIFFHSGSRETEMLRLTESDVDIEGQRFKVLVLKGNVYREEWRPIKNIALWLWKEVMSEASEGQYLFGKGLRPEHREKPIRAEQIPRRWRTWVKKAFKVTADFYSLKHTNLDETAEILNLREAQRMAGHASEKTTEIYTIGEIRRKNNKLIEVNNSFSGKLKAV